MKGNADSPGSSIGSIISSVPLKHLPSAILKGLPVSGRRASSFVFALSIFSDRRAYSFGGPRVLHGGTSAHLGLGQFPCQLVMEEEDTYRVYWSMMQSDVNGGSLSPALACVGRSSNKLFHCAPTREFPEALIGAGRFIRADRFREIRVFSFLSNVVALWKQEAYVDPPDLVSESSEDDWQIALRRGLIPQVRRRGSARKARLGLTDDESTSDEDRFAVSD